MTLSVKSRESTLERVDARLHRDAIIALYERNGYTNFPRLFDWYYGDQPTPVSWIVREGNDGHVFGMCSVVPRVLRFGDVRLRMGVMGNLLVDRAQRTTLAAVSLVRAVRSLLSDKEFDILIGMPNQSARALFLKMGAQVIDYWQTQAQVFHSRDLLQKRLGRVWMQASPFVDVLARCRRTFGVHPNVSQFCLSRLSEEEVRNLKPLDWAAQPERFSAALSGERLHRRYLESPLKQYEIFGIRRKEEGSVCGYLVITRSPEGRVEVCDCDTDAARLSAEEALAVLCAEHTVRQNMVCVPTLRSGPLAKHLSRQGMTVTHRLGGFPPYPLVAFWEPTHQYSKFFAQTCYWNLFVGCNDV